MEAQRTNRLIVLPTTDRTQAAGDYVAFVGPSEKRLSGYGRIGVVRREVPLDGGARSVTLSVPCRVLVDEHLDRGHIRIDQTLRNAIGLTDPPMQPLEISIHALHLTAGQHLRDRVTRWAGRRFLFMRACKAATADMEKDLCRIPGDVFAVLGCEPGDRVVLETAAPDSSSRYRLRSIAITAYELSERMLADRRSIEQPATEAKYHAAAEILGVTPDLPPIFLDLEARQWLGIRDLPGLHAVRVRRDPLALFTKQIRELGIILMISALAAVQVLPVTIDRWWKSALVFSGALALAVILVVLKLRSGLGSKRIRVLNDG